MWRLKCFLFLWGLVALFSFSVLADEADEADEIKRYAVEPVTSTAESIFIDENWMAPRLYMEWVSPNSEFNVFYSYARDWGIGVGASSYHWAGGEEMFHGVFGRYYLPTDWIQGVQSLKMSRPFIESYWQRIASRKALSAGTYYAFGEQGLGFGVKHALGLESRWDTLTTRVGLQLTTNFFDNQETQFFLLPFLAVGFEFPWELRPEVSQEYLAYKQQLIETELGPLIQLHWSDSLANSGSLGAQHRRLGAMIIRDHVGIGFYQGQEISLLSKILLSDTLGLLGRYYFDPVHPGLQAYLEGESNLGSHTHFVARFGLEHRELWGGVVGMALGVGAQKTRNLQTYAPVFDLGVSVGYAWSLVPLEAQPSPLLTPSHLD